MRSIPLSSPIETLRTISSGLRFAVIGDLMLDENIEGPVKRISPEAPVLILNKSRRKVSPGGAANAARQLLALGAHCTVIGVVGNDAPALELQTLLSSTSHARSMFLLVTDETRPTTLKTRFWGTGHGPCHQLFRMDTESTQSLLPEVKRALVSAVSRLRPRDGSDGYDYIVISDYGKGVVCEEVVAAALSTGIPVMAAPKPVNGHLFAGACVIVPNIIEARAIAGTADDIPIEQVAATLQSRLTAIRVPTIIITLGKDGILALDPSGALSSMRTSAREVYDVTGAGDVVLGTLALGFAAGLALDQVIRIANAAGGVKVAKVGAASVSLDEIDAALPSTTY